jgi:hypothetical protein
VRRIGRPRAPPFPWVVAPISGVEIGRILLHAGHLVTLIPVLSQATATRPACSETPGRHERNAQVDVGAPGHGHRRQHHRRDALGVPLGVGQGQRHAPGVAPHQPPFDAEMRAQALEVADQVRRRVGRHGREGLRAGDAATGAPLVEQDDAVAVGVEVPAVAGRAARAGAAVQDDGRLALRVAADLPVEAVAVPDVQQALRVRLERRVKRQVSQSPCPRANAATRS